MRPGGCGHDPRVELTDGDRTAVAAFRRYLEVAHKRDHGEELTTDEQEFVTAYETPAGDPPA